MSATPTLPSGTGANLPDPVTVAHGGTGGTTQGTAQSGLGLGTAATHAVGDFDAAGAAAAAQAASQPLDADLTALAALDGTAGFLSRTGVGSFAVRTLTQGTNITISNSTGSGGNPTISQTVASPTTFTGTPQTIPFRWSWNKPAGTDLVSVVAVANFTDGTPLAIAAQPVIPCVLQVSLTDALNAKPPFHVVIVGTLTNGLTKTDSIAIGGFGTDVEPGVWPFAQVTSITPVGASGAAAVTLSVGIATGKLGLPIPSTATSFTLYGATRDASRDAGTLDTTHFIYQPQNPPDSTHDFDLWGTYIMTPGGTLS